MVILNKLVVVVVILRSSAFGWKSKLFFGKKMPFVWEKFVDVKNCPEL